MKSNIITALVVLASVVVFFALVGFLGGYGAMISACIIAGLANECHEQITQSNE